MRKFMCWFAGHDFEKVSTVRGRVGKYGSVVRTEFQCKRCGVSKITLDIDAELRASVEDVCKKNPSKSSARPAKQAA